MEMIINDMHSQMSFGQRRKLSRIVKEQLTSCGHRWHSSIGIGRLPDGPILPANFVGNAHRGSTD
jgi:hypothetical protein